MRIVFLNPFGEVGGAELSMLDLMAGLATVLPGVEQHLIVTEDGPLVARAEALGVRARCLPMPAAVAGLGDSALRGRGKLAAAATLAVRVAPVGLGVRRYARQMRVAVRTLRPAVVHSNGIKTHLLARIAGLAAEAPVVWHVRDFYGSRPLVSRALRWASGGVGAAIAVSETAGRDAWALLPGVPVTAAYDAIDLDRFVPGPGDGPRLDDLAHRPRPDAPVVRVGLLATYARWKGQDLLLHAIARLPADLPARFYIIGGPIYKTKGSQFTEAELRGLAESLGVGGRVGFVPFQEETAELYRALDIVVHASTHPEPFGRTIVEAMACGRPVLVAQAGGAAELFRPGHDAVGVPPGDADALATALRSLILDPERRHQLAAAARLSAHARFTRERLGRQVAAVYRRLIGAEPG